MNKYYAKKPTKRRAKANNKAKGIFIMLLLAVMTINCLYTALVDKKVDEVVEYTQITVEPHHEAIKGIVESIVEVDKMARVTCYIDTGLMANGKYTYYGAVAFSDRTVPLNQNIYVEGFGEMFIADRTAQWVHDKYPVPTIDIWMTEADCKAFGMKYLSYKIL